MAKVVDSEKQWIKKYLSAESEQKISQAVQVAELQTSGEIVPVIIRKSSATGHIPLILTLILFLLTFLLALTNEALFFQKPWVWLWPIWLFCEYVLSIFLAKLAFLQKWFVPEEDQQFQVFNRAHMEFYINHLHKTQQKTGVLIFVSVMERKAIILADEGISQKIPQSQWNDIIKILIHDMKCNQWEKGFLTAIQKIGLLLKEHFPHQGPHQNELSNKLVIADRTSFEVKA